MPTTDFAKLSPAQTEELRRHYEHLGKPSFLQQKFGLDHGDPKGDITVRIISTPIRPETNDWLREQFQASRGESIGENAARRVAYYVKQDVEYRYPDSINARCVAMAGEEDHQGLLAVTWMRGREVFHRRHNVPARIVAVTSARHVAATLLPTIIRQIESTEGAEYP